MCTKAYHAHYRHQQMPPWAKHWMHKKWNRSQQDHRDIPINIEELDDKYEITFLIPGFEKSDFSIHLRDEYLYVSADREMEDREAYWKRRDFGPRKFKRRFELNEKIDKDSIQAEYKEGILKITLQKVEGSETLRKQIEVL